MENCTRGLIRELLAWAYTRRNTVRRVGNRREKVRQTTSKNFGDISLSPYSPLSFLGGRYLDYLCPATNPNRREAFISRVLWDMVAKRDLPTHAPKIKKGLPALLRQIFRLREEKEGRTSVLSHSRPKDTARRRESRRRKRRRRRAIRPHAQISGFFGRTPLHFPSPLPPLPLAEKLKRDRRKEGGGRALQTRLLFPFVTLYSFLPPPPLRTGAIEEKKTVVFPLVLPRARV